ncbi:CHASE2 domain-containing sensor protein [Amycolatopsis lexingtonensis]|uniref:CHASE2 domain-containing sensor protein n=1 Tax=Amycolatopsis lexingtonensis TaxID=218822 RepID=A0ABR9I7E7_9PSEU|nr:hypothetical protein [Amycolatopsis lexingtonensis]MBE1499110.1 CHASE2 domain-containing sensor protein [Amycolatopsis lexingtonensis]
MKRIAVIAYGLFTVAGGVLGATGTRPDSSAAEVAAYDAAHQGLVQLLALVVFGAGLSLAVWTAAARPPQLGYAGGLLASGSLLLSGLATWTAAQNPDVARPFTSLAFAAGAFGFAVPLALLIADVARTERKWLAVTGYVVAALAGLSGLSMLTDVLYPLIPVARFGGLVWLVLATFVKPRD